MKNVYRWLAGWMAALCLLTALAVPVSAEGFDYTWDQDTENNPGGPHCKAYLMLNLDTDTVVYSDNADEQLPMASLTKIMTYIVAYENIPDIENARITIPQSVVDELSGTGSSVATFDVGETYTGLDMLYLMMVPSGNNAALTLAKYVDQLYAQLLEYRELIRPYVGDAVGFVHQALKGGKTVLLEGQLGSMKDPDLGIFPMTTSSHTLAGFGCVGAAVPPTAVKDVICVSKAYSSSVGSNTEPFVSELLGDAGEELRRRGGDKGEYGATTGRPRRVGWFDTVATKYGCMIQGATQVALTCLDVLGYLDEIPVCTGYEIDGEVTDEFPVTPLLMKAKPVFTTLPGWKCDIRGCRDYDQLPENAKKYVDFLEAHIQAPITMVSTGPERHEMTSRTPKL